MTAVFKDITEVFNLKGVDALMSGSGDAIPVQVLPDRGDFTKNFVPDIDEGYVFPIEQLISVIVALDARVRKNVLLWGLHGSGKSTLAEQTCAYTNRPAIRVQHSIDTERPDILGQWTLVDGKTVFQLGPLAKAMIHGLVYIADEYDFALPNVLAAYQAVLEPNGRLVIPNAPEEYQVIKPHPDFRFIATGNTNGGGDETGLYQGTQMQNAANYSRFQITEKIDYQDAETEARIVVNRIPKLPPEDAKQLINFGTKVRDAYANRTITNTLSTREIVNIAHLSCLRAREGKINWKYGIRVGFTNRMSTVDKAAIEAIAQRDFGIKF